MPNEVPTLRMPAEWEPHRATWIAWPHNPADWPGKFETIPWVYVEIVRVLAASEHVEILCQSESARDAAEGLLRRSGVTENFTFHLCPTDRSWLRDSAPTGVLSREGGLSWVQWRFNAWAKYDNYSEDSRVPARIAGLTGRDLIPAARPDRGGALVLEGGAIEVNGDGMMLTTEECLLSAEQQRNPGLTREQYEEAFARYLGVRHTVWLAGSCEGDDTHGHIDDAARFVATDTVLVASESDESDVNHRISQENIRRLKGAVTSGGRRLNIVTIPMPGRMDYDDYRLPASYVNFYIANRSVLVPTFNDPRDITALRIISELFPRHTVCGINCRDLILGLGTLHCLTQQEPLGSRK